MNVLEKENLTKYEVHLKIDNLNVEDMFNRNRTNELLDIFRFVDKFQGKRFPMFYIVLDQVFPFFSFYLQKEVMERCSEFIRDFFSICSRAWRSFASEAKWRRRVSLVWKSNVMRLIRLIREKKDLDVIYSYAILLSSAIIIIIERFNGIQRFDIADVLFDRSTENNIMTHIPLRIFF